MERVEHYRQCIRQLLNQEATVAEEGPDIECQLIKEDIIFGLHPPYKRPYTGYGVA
jgi:hypothetical protein